MGLFDFLKRKDPALQDVSKKTELPALITTPVTNQTFPLTKSEDYLKHAVGWVYSCITAIGNYIADIPIHLYRRRGDKVTEIFNHPLLDLVYKVNPFTTKFDHFKSTSDYLELTGEAPWFLAIEGGKPTGILLLRPDKLTIKHDPKNIISHYEYKVDARKAPVRIEKEELILLKRPDPCNLFRGRGTLKAAVRQVDLEMYAEEYNIEFFKNSARPDFFLTTEQDMTQEQKDELREIWNKKFAGEGNRFKLGILSGGVKSEQLGLSQRDMEFLEQQRFGRDKIFSIFGCPKNVVGISDDVNRANAEAGNYVFARYTIKPKMTQLIEQLNEFLTPLFGDDLFLDFEDPVPEDVELKLKTYDNALRTGWMTINEIRDLENLKPVDGGDVPLVPMAMIPLGEEGMPPEKQLKYNKEFARRISKGKKKLKEIKILDESIKELAKEIIMAEEDKKPKTKEERWWRNQIKIADRFERLFMNRLKGIFNQQEKEILKQLGVKAPVDVNKIKLDITKEGKVFIQAFVPVLRGLIKNEGDRVMESLGIAEGIDLGSTRVRGFLEKKPIKFAKKVNKTTNLKIRKALATGIAEGEGIEKLGRRIRGVFKSASRYRTIRIARSETMRATNFASEAAYIQSNIVKGEQWLAEFDNRTCEYCAAMNGKVVKLEENFFDKGDSFRPRGADSSLEFNYDNIPYPPLHTSCRCTTIPVLK